MNSLAIYTIFNSIDFLKKTSFSKIKHDLTEYLIKKLRNMSNIIVYLPEQYVSKGIVSFNVNGFTSDEIGTILSEDYGICVRTGYHCCPFVHDFIDSKKFSGTVRISLSGFNTINDIDKLIEALESI